MQSWHRHKIHIAQEHVAGLHIGDGSVSKKVDRISGVAGRLEDDMEVDRVGALLEPWDVIEDLCSLSIEKYA